MKPTKFFLVHSGFKLNICLTWYFKQMWQYLFAFLSHVYFEGSFVISLHCPMIYFEKSCEQASLKDLSTDKWNVNIWTLTHTLCIQQLNVWACSLIGHCEVLNVYIQYTIATTKCWCLCFQCDRDVCMRLLLQVKGVVSITFDMNRKRCIIRTKVDVRPEVSNIFISVVCWLTLAPYSLILKIISAIENYSSLLTVL